MTKDRVRTQPGDVLIATHAVIEPADRSGGLSREILRGEGLRASA
jgi:hypothetical protein